MSYLKDFLKYIANHDYPGFLKLWEEYCSGDELEGQELIEILRAAQASSFNEFFGKHIQRVLPLWEKLANPEESHEAFRLLIDLDNTKDPKMGEKVFNYLENRYGNQPLFQEKIRLIGFRNRDKFQRVISNYELLSHINKGKFVFHTAGWGVGVILDFSLVREQLSVEFEYVSGKKEISFETAFKTLLPLPDDHFLARRFGDPDRFEQYAKEEPVETIRILLKDLGPKTAAEIKDELCELVIQEKDWTKWWQNARAKIKKDTRIETPDDIRKPFQVRQEELSHEARFQQALDNKPDANTLIQMVYSFLKDFSETLKNPSFKTNLCKKLEEMLSYPELSSAQKLQILFLMQDLGLDNQTEEIQKLFKGSQTATSAQELLQAIEILSFKKRALVHIKQTQPDWKSLFRDLFLSLEQATLRDYVLTELLAAGCEKEIEEKLQELAATPARSPETFIWYFQKLMSQKKLPFSHREGKARFFESFLILLSHLEQLPNQKDLVKKMHAILSDGRYAMVRQLMKEAHVEEVKEFLLLATKCHSLESHDIKLLHSLAEVAHPSLAKHGKKGSKDLLSEDASVIWTTQQGQNKLQERIRQIATVETVDNAKEIETARGHGDLRENAEFKAALERRDRLQSELKTLSDQLNQTRVLTTQDVSTDKIGVGCVVTCEGSNGNTTSYTLLGPWDADPEKNILAFQSKLAQTMKGLSIGQSFQFQGENLTVAKIANYFAL